MEVHQFFSSPLNENLVVKRQKRHVYAGVSVISTFFLTILIYTSFDVNHFVTVTTISGVVVWTGYTIVRLSLCVEELFHLERVHGGSYLTLVQRTLSSNTVSFFVSLTLFMLFVFKLSSLETIEVYGPLPFYLSTCAFVVLFSMIRAEVCPTWEAHTMTQLNGLDYGSGLAHSFFHGYLRLILPAKGDNLTLRDRIDIFIEKEKICKYDFPVKKLIVLIPSSGYSYPTFLDVPSATSGDIESVKALQDHLQDRAGTERRVYRGGAYCIRVKLGGEDKRLYAVFEGATPALTFKEACSSGTSESVHLRQHRVDIVSNFYRTLKQLVDEDKTVQHLVELIYYNDEDITNPADVICLLQEYLLKKRKELPFSSGKY